MTKAILTAIRRLSVLRFFPQNSVAQAEIMALLERMTSNEREIEWLVETLVDTVDEWPGLRSVRGLFCTRFRPRDGKETECSLAGYRAEDCEAAAALEPARLLCGTAEQPMDEDELQKFHRELLTPLLRPRQPPHFDFETLRRVESEIATCKPTLSEQEKRRRIDEIKAALKNQN